MHIPEKIISGGQTSADIGALIGARRLGIATGGTAPGGFRTEQGNRKTQLISFGLVAHRSRAFKDSALQNVIDADATLVFSKNASHGTCKTIKFCEEEKKPYCLLERFDDNDLRIAAMFIHNGKPRVLNIAGVKQSRGPDLTTIVADFIEKLFKECNA